MKRRNVDVHVHVTGEGEDFRDIGEAVGMSHAKARYVYLRTIARFIHAYCPEMSRAECKKLAATEAAQLMVRELVEAVECGGRDQPLIDRELVRLVPVPAA